MDHFLSFLFPKSLSGFILKNIIFSRNFLLVYFVQDFWIFSLISRTAQGIYLSLFHLFLLAFLMSAMSYPILFVLENSEEASIIHYFTAMIQNVFIPSFALILGTLYVPEKISYNVIKYTKFITAFSGAAMQSTMFFIFRLFPIEDQRFKLIAVVASTLFPQIVDLVIRMLTHKGCESCFTSNKTLFRAAIICAFASSLNYPSAISSIFGTLPYHYSALVLFLFLFVLYIIC